ncbi:MAG: universal stress protein [Acidimicrobiia bacterium]
MSEATCILVAVDHSPGSLTALARAQALTNVTGDSLVVCTVLDEEPDDEVFEQARLRLASVTRQADVQVRFGTAFIELIRAAREANARLIVAGATGEHTEGQLALGVTIDRLARKADRPVLVVRKPPRNGYRSVIVGLDGSTDAARAAHLARQLSPQSRITGVMAAPPIGEHLLKTRGAGEKALSTYRNRLQENAREKLATAATGLPIDHQEAIVGRPETVLLEAADIYESDLLAVGRHGISPLAAVLLGSVGHHLVHEAPCDVLVYRSRDLGFQPP